MRHEEPDRVPLFYRDIPEVDARLRRDLGVDSREELYEYFDIDFRWVEPAYVGPPLKDEKTGHVRSIWGIEYRCVEAANGVNWEPVEFPLQAMQAPAELTGHSWPRVEWYDFAALNAQLEEYKDYAIMTAPGVASPSVLGLMEELMGIERTLMDMLDPIQVRAAGMEPAGLKRDFGDRICFSGGVDEQELLPRGTPARVRDGVCALLETMAPGGGFILGPTHNLQCDIPTENVLAMYEAARSWRYY